MPYDFNQQDRVIKSLSVPSASLTLTSLSEHTTWARLTLRSN